MCPYVDKIKLNFVHLGACLAVSLFEFVTPWSVLSQKPEREVIFKHLLFQALKSPWGYETQKPSPVQKEKTKRTKQSELSFFLIVSQQRKQNTSDFPNKTPLPHT